MAKFSFVVFRRCGVEFGTVQATPSKVKCSRGIARCCGVLFW